MCVSVDCDLEYDGVMVDDLMKNELFKYIKDSQNRKIGVLFACVIDDQVCFGWSLTNKEDEFDKTTGISLAQNRAIHNITDRYDKYFEYADYTPTFELIDDIIPFTVKKEIPQFFDRMSRYYKNNRYSFVVEYIMNYYSIK